METLKKSLLFIMENPLILLPAIIAALIPNLMTFNINDSVLYESMFSELNNLFMGNGNADLNHLTDMSNRLSLNDTTSASIIGIVLNLIATPLVYTLAFKNKIELVDMTENLTTNILKYILYGLSIIALIFIVIIGAILFTSIFAFLQSPVLTTVAAVTVAIAFFILMLKLSFLFPIYITQENPGIIKAAKESIELTSGLVGKIFVINFLIGLAAILASIIAFFAPTIVIMYTIIISVVSALSTTVSTVFIVKLYIEEKPFSMEFSEAESEESLY